MHGKHEGGTKPARKFRRRLTPFLCQEMLFEYASGRLDAERAADIEAFLPSDRASQEALEDVRRGLDYADRLQQAELPAPLLFRVAEAESLRSVIRRYMDWDEWPETLRWSASALAVSVLVAGVIAVVPWQKVSSLTGKNQRAVVLAEIRTGSGLTSEVEPEPNAATEAAEDLNAVASKPKDDGLGSSGDEHDDGRASREAVAAQQSMKETKPVVIPAAPEKPNAPVGSIMASKPSVTTVPTTPSAALSLPTPAESNPPKDAKPKGFVYRAFMDLPNLDAIAPEISSQIAALGGEKAGEVPLGWRKTSGGAELGSYFHFVLPAANEAKLMELLRAYGPVRLSKDPHPRVMPEGQIRFILWIEPVSSR